MLNPSQQEASKTLDGPLCIIAGPGTGKTHTLIHRINNIIVSQEATGSQILIITFTNKAAHELKERLQKNKHYGVQAMTFHSLAAKILRKYWKEDFTINDEEDPETLSFDDLLTKLLELWDQDIQSLKKSQENFKYIMVDEYQDVNQEQIKIIQKLAQTHQNICVVGDADQTIYSWRGSHAQNMNKFIEHFPSCQTIYLEQNYRNPPNILKAATELISNNPKRPAYNLEAIKTDSVTPKVWKSNNPWEDTEMIFHLLEKYLGSHSNMVDADILDAENQTEFSFSDIAFIYRTQDQGKILSKKIEKRGYPCQLSAPENFWEKPEITQFIDDLKPLINLPEFPNIKFSDWIQKRIKIFIENQEFSSEKENSLNLILSTAIHFNNSKIPKALQAFLDEVETNQEADNLIKPNAIQLLTFHAAKGLEFPIVIILGLNENTIPHKQSLHDSYMLTEERRLLYVGMTRATKELHLFTQNKKTSSRFLKEIKTIQSGALPQEKQQRLKKREMKRAQQSLF